MTSIDTRVTDTRAIGPQRPPGLADLATLELATESKTLLDLAAAESLGSAVWRRRKLAEAHGLLALAQIAPRLVLRHLDMRTDLVVLIELRDTPVACMRSGASEVHIECGALLAIEYPEAIIAAPIPGTRPVRVLAPHEVYHANVAYGIRVPPLCLGASVPRGLPLREIVLASYAALTLQAITLDVLDPAGVLNGEAARWWQANAARIPLTTEPFLGRRDAQPPVAPSTEDPS